MFADDVFPHLSNISVEFIGSGKTFGVSYGLSFIWLFFCILPHSLEHWTIFCSGPCKWIFVRHSRPRWNFRCLAWSMMQHYRNKHGTTHSYPPLLPPHTPPLHTPSPPLPPQRKGEHFVFKHPFSMTFAPKYEIRNLLVKTFHLIYYITTFLKL